jgi:hypothetical protein
MFCLPKANLIIASRRPRYFLNESVKSGDSQVMTNFIKLCYGHPKCRKKVNQMTSR